jgi:uncharacterized protein (TIGR04255 family)
MEKLPKKISPCPIIEAILEIRYTPNIPKNAVFGVFYSLLADDKFTTKNLPILQLPEEIRSNDTALIYSPHYEMQKDDFIIKIGPNVLNFSITQHYPGWDHFVKDIFKVLRKIEETNLVLKYNRLGIRYINFFEIDIFEKLQITIELLEKKLDSEKITLQTEKYNNGILSKLKIANNSRLNVANEIRKGSIIDIDCLNKISNDDKFQDNYEEIINSVHLAEKATFFKLLKKEFLSDLNPEY